MEKKKFKLTDAVLSVICVVFVAEAAAPVASLGNSQFFWWIFMIVAFLLPYGLIASELGTTYPGDGGLYDWISTAWPQKRWGARAAWWYWLNFPLWMASLAVMAPDLIALILGMELNLWVSLTIQLAFIAIVTLVACYPVCDNIFLLNACAVIKVVLAVGVGVMGIWFGIRNGFANDMRPATFLPSFRLDSLSYISVVIFNMLGFEVVCTFSDDMQNPKKQIPQAIVIGGLVIAAIYLLGGFGIGAGIPVEQISADSGLLDAVVLMSGREGGWFLSAVAALFLVTLFGNMISWSLGVNNTACYAAEHGDMPRVFTRRWKKNGMPVGAAAVNGIVGSVVCLLGVVMTLLWPESELFWTFFALNLVLFLISYLPIFPAFLALRRKDPHRPRPFRVPGGRVTLRVLAIVPMVLIAVAVVFCALPMSLEPQALEATLPITFGAVVTIGLGEWLIRLREKKANDKQ